MLCNIREIVVFRKIKLTLPYHAENIWPPNCRTQMTWPERAIRSSLWSPQPVPTSGWQAQYKVKLPLLTRPAGNRTFHPFSLGQTGPAVFRVCGEEPSSSLIQSLLIGHRTYPLKNTTILSESKLKKYIHLDSWYVLVSRKLIKLFLSFHF